MRYFSYNDFNDYAENGEIDGIDKVRESVSKYEVKNGKHMQDKKYKILKILKSKIHLNHFLGEFFEFYGSGSIQDIEYISNTKFNFNQDEKDNLILKINEKEIFILIKVIEGIDNNISYKMFENSINIIKQWNLEEKIENARYPIVIPIVIYIGREQWKNSNKKYRKINYMTCENNRINFSYNMIDINDLKIKELEKMKSTVAKEFVKIKNKYLQIN